ncbi:MAG TPA: SpoIIE family protein phosphatase [Solirubrobacteraceae bacterium]|nr:SpoIIE family protein phosphatase [Solirubrobacteraceae bacterium]
MTADSTRESLREFLSRRGEVGRDLLAVDWAATPLGPIDDWPGSLATVVRVLLTSRFAMWMAWGPELTFLCNDTYRRDTLGEKYPWALGQPARAVWEEIWPEIGPRIEAVLRTGEATWDEALLLILERSGYREETYHTFSYSPLPDDEGRISGILCVVSEDTTRVIGERRMATLRELGALSSGVQDEREFLDVAAHVLEGNPNSLPFTIVYLFDADGTARLACSSGIRPGHPAAPQCILPADPGSPWPVGQVGGGRSVRLDVTGDRHPALPMGAWEEPPYEALMAPILDPAHASPYGFLIVGLNPHTPLDSEYRSFVELLVQHFSAGLGAARTYEAERQRAEALEELDRAKTAFFSNVSHEFRTPLTLMLGPLQDAMGDPDGLDSQRLELVHRNAVRLLKLVNALLDFSRAEAGRMRAEFRPTDIGQLTAELVGTFREATERAGLELVVACDSPPEPVYLDRDLWERIVLNLLSNAFKATLEGRIEVRIATVDGQVELSVTDTGTGIPPEELARLFQRFHRVRTVARSYEGTGIGLALVKELIDLHGGQVGVASTLGEGSRFTVQVPLGSAHLPADQVHEESLVPAASIASLFVEEAMSWIEAPGVRGPDDHAPDGGADRAGVGRPRVLVVDDNPDLRRYLTTLLASQFEVETVGDGTAALAIVRDRPPDLLVSDVMMPGLDGYELLDEVRSAPETRDLPVILLSARAGEEAAIEGLEAGADDYLPKPFSGRELLARVRAHLDLSTVRRQAAADLRAEQRRLEQTLEQLPAGVMLAQAPSRAIVFSNQQASDILGHGILPHEAGGEYDGYQLHTLDRRRLRRDEGPLARAMVGGEVVEDQDMLYVTGSGRTIVVRISAAPIRNEAGEVVAGVLVFQDVSERVRSGRLLTAQRDILQLVASGASLEHTLEAIVLCVEDLAEYTAWGSVLLLSADGRRLLHGAAPSMPDAYNQAVDGLEIGPAVGSCGTAAFRGETVVVSDTSSDPLWADYRDLAAEHRLAAGWATPIHADDGELVGTLAVYYDEPREPSPEDRRVVDLMAGTAGVAIGRARDASNRAQRLAELQSSLLPRALPEVPGIGAAVSFRPEERGSDIGGDFYDLFSLPGDAWGLVVGDVCGHGAEAAAVTALTRHTTRAVARLQRSPARVLSIVNDELRASDHDRFCTALYGRIEPVADGVVLTLACGGHPPPLVRRAAGSIETIRVRGPLLGAFSDAVFPETTVGLHPGDTVLVYTDGVVERNPRVAGEGGLRALVGSVRFDDVDELMAELERRAFGSPPEPLPDDAALLAVQVQAPAAGSADPEAVGAAVLVHAVAG